MRCELALPGGDGCFPGGLRQATHELHIELDAVKQPSPILFAELGFVPSTDPGILGTVAVFLRNFGELPKVIFPGRTVAVIGNINDRLCHVV